MKKAAILAVLLPAALQAEPEKIVVTGHQWAPFISPMGEPFRARSTADDTLMLWFTQADSNRDGNLNLDEFQADAGRFFVRLDTNADGHVDPDEMVRYEWEVAPDIQVNRRTQRAPGSPAVKLSDAERDRLQLRRTEFLQGAARYALLNIPQPVAAADRNFDRSVTALEFRSAAAERFRLLDTAHDGRLTFEDLDRIRAQMIAAAKKKRRGRDEDDQRVGTPL